ncbi:zinc-binding dehydrogenase [Nonomuraea sp. NPDC049504]|uniref:zinc-binding dehydrogenase n=1 Tax=Nonomuraea sp. NPDC049504 TaxID=3154729 RepID=UPI00344764F8
MELAALGGAHVIASVGSPARAEGPAGLGADEVVVGLDGVDRPVDLILDTVGGPRLAAAWQLLAPGGNVQNIGWASDEPAVFEPYSLTDAARALLNRRVAGKAVLDVTP